MLLHSFLPNGTLVGSGRNEKRASYTRMRHDFPCRVGLYPPNSKPDRKMFLQTSIYILLRFAMYAGLHLTRNLKNMIIAQDIFRRLICENGCKWRRLPKGYGNWHVIYKRFNRWVKAGVIERLFREMHDQSIIEPDQAIRLMDSMTVPVHPDACGALY